jgi:hypothetical protein
MSRSRLRLLVVAETVVDPVDLVCPILLRWPSAEIHVVVMAPSAWSTALAAATEEAWMGLAPLDPALTASVHRAEQETATAHADEVRGLLRTWGVTATAEVARWSDERRVVETCTAHLRPDVVVVGEPRERIRRWRWSRTLRRLHRRTGLTVIDLGWRAPLGTYVPAAPEAAPA